MFLEAYFSPALGVSAIVWSAATLAFWWSTGHGRLHYIPTAGLIALSSLLPLFGVIQPGADAVGTTMTIVGVVYVINGLLDHLELTRVMPAVRKEEHEAAV